MSSTCDDPDLVDDMLFGACPVEVTGAYSGDAMVVVKLTQQVTIRLNQVVGNAARNEASILVWNSAVSLATEWARPGSLLPPAAQARVLDLGAGLGLCALAAAALGAAEVVATEIAPALAALRASIESQDGSGCNAERIRVVELPWGEGIEPTLLGAEAAPYDCIICSDCIYAPLQHHALLRTLQHVMTPSVTRLILAFERRGEEAHFFAAAAHLLPRLVAVQGTDVIGPDDHNVEIHVLEMEPAL